MGDALADLFDRWHAEAREDDETVDWAEEGEREQKYQENKDKQRRQ